MATKTKRPDPRRLTDEEAFLIRRVAVLCGWKLGQSDASSHLHGIADDHGAPQECEGCPSPATVTDIEGVPLCEPCAATCPAAEDEDA